MFLGKYRNGVWYGKMCYLSNGERKIVNSVGIEFRDGKVIKLLQESESYK